MKRYKTDQKVETTSTGGGSSISGTTFSKKTWATLIIGIAFLIIAIVLIIAIK